MMLPLRGSRHALTISWDLDDLVLSSDDLNKSFEEMWLSLLSVLVERWPDWPIEIWTRLVPVITDEAKARWDLEFLVSVGSEGPDDKHVAAVVRYLTAGVAKLIPIPPRLSWNRILTDCKPLWLVDDAQVYRVLAPEAGEEPALYLLGHYAGQPAWFAATVEAWPLHGVRLEVQLADVDTAWAFDA